MEEDKWLDVSPSALCRCCLVERSYKDMSLEHYVNGKKEVYIDMLKDTFGLTISYPYEASTSSSSPLICDPCISRLRDASEFKRQVQDSEEMFKKHVESGFTANLLELFKNTSDLQSDENMKIEVLEDFDDEEYEYQNEYDHDSPFIKQGDDCVCDHNESTEKPPGKVMFTATIPMRKSKTVPFIKLENVDDEEKTSYIQIINRNNNKRTSMPTRVSPKKSVKVTIQPEAAKTKKSVITLRKRDLKSEDDDEWNMSISKISEKVRKVQRDKEDAKEEGDSLRHPTPIWMAKRRKTPGKPNNVSISQYPIPNIQRLNAKNIVLHSTAYPFRLPRNNAICVYCAESFDDPSAIRPHMEEKHPKVNLSAAFHHITVDVSLKVDCSDLRCRQCDETFQNLDSIAQHLLKQHKVKLDLTTGLGLCPFKFKPNKPFLACAVCPKMTRNIKSLSKHTSTHYMKHTCEKCGKQYSDISAMKNHQICGHNIKPICTRCKATFETREQLHTHIENSSRCRSYVCNICYERFATAQRKYKHMTMVHGNDVPRHKCKECDKAFARYETCMKHFIIEHTNEYSECAVCRKRFGKPKDLVEHMVTHSGETPFSCEQCSKSYSTVKCLKQHIRISHKGHYFCDKCNKQFGCKSSLKNHLMSHHPEMGGVV